MKLSPASAATTARRLRDRPVRLSLLLLAGALIILGIVSVMTARPELHDGRTVTVKIDKALIKAKVAAKDQSRAAGLAAVPQLSDKDGMLFTYPQPQVPEYWMKGVAYPIDIIWIRDDTVSEVTANVPGSAGGTPDDQLPRYRPTAPVTHVIEVSGGWTTRNGIQPGDPVRITR